MNKHEHKQEHCHSHEHHGNCTCGTHDCCHDHSEQEHKHAHQCECGCHHRHESTSGCACGCHHGHGEGSARQAVTRLVVSAVLLACAVFTDIYISLPLLATFMLYLPAYLVAGYDVLLNAVREIARGSIFNETLLMCIATVGALTVGFIPGGEPQFAEAVLVMVLFKLGELMEGLAETKSRRSIEALMDIRPDFANVERHGEIYRVDPSSVDVGDVIIVRPGERIPLDGIILEGCAALDTVALTGESRPRDVESGDTVCSGCVDLSGLLRIKVTKPFGDSTATKILELVRSANQNKSKSESFIRRFARWYTPLVVVAAAALALLPPLLSGDFGANFAVWFVRGLTFLVVSCPCALVISVPLTFFGGIGGASRQGILIKGGNYIEALSRVDTVVLDKTGTLTEGSFEVSSVFAADGDRRRLLRLAALAECHSSHPIAKSLRRAYGDLPDTSAVIATNELSGRGVTANIDGRFISVGNLRLMQELGAEAAAPQTHGAAAVIHVAEGNKYLGYILISDVIKPDSDQALRALEALGVRRTVMLTGDTQQVAAAVATDLAIKEYRAQLLPADKVDEVEKLLSTKRRRTTLAFVGDGINDAPVLARADIGIAMGKMGTDAAVEAADIVIMDDDLTKLARAVSICRRTVAIAHQNIAFAIAVKLSVLALTALGLTPMWLAVFSDVGVMLIAVLNAMRAMKKSNR